MPIEFLSDPPSWHDDVWVGLERAKDVRNAAIEECARVAEQFGGHNVPLIAAAIRKLKDVR